MSPLSDWGWSDFFETEYRKMNLDADDVLPARVVEEMKNAFRVRGETGNFLAELSGRLRHDAESREHLPAVGDWVLITLREREGRATIRGVLPRRSKVSRKVAGRATAEQVIAANLDTIFVASSLNRDFNVRRIERYLAIVWDSGASPVIVLTKSDLCEDTTMLLAELHATVVGVPVHVLSVVSGEGLDALKKYLHTGLTVALIGSSGVGKSTLINRLLGREELFTKPVREEDDRGRHATISRRLVMLPSGGMLIDTPGMRELQLWQAETGLERAFEDISELSAGCQFRDCSHISEPGCAVRQAIDEGTLNEERLENLRKLEREQEFLARKQDAALQSAEEKKWRKVHHAQRRNYQRRERHGRI